ncbi:uncharacterized protein LOC131069300 isoform X5 [Cryptomeria japonica]|uniref:uncharacterized protein LOC131069300 isoform X5 n=1 Tax=Cryptomeria japonica TaxID=3369 RepID=UPI0027DA8CD6|nr:uncharacterized protein LOC131069300 isoform X5 [Cryptomeria japonica]
MSTAETNLCLDGDLENQSFSRPMIDDGAIDSSSGKETTFSLNKEGSSQSVSAGDRSNNVNLQLTCFTEEAHDVTLHFQIISLSKQASNGDLGVGKSSQIKDDLLQSSIERMAFFDQTSTRATSSNLALQGQVHQHPAHQRQKKSEQRAR